MISTRSLMCVSCRRLSPRQYRKAAADVPEERVPAPGPDHEQGAQDRDGTKCILTPELLDNHLRRYFVLGIHEAAIRPQGTRFRQRLVLVSMRPIDGRRAQLNEALHVCPGGALHHGARPFHVDCILQCGVVDGLDRTSRGSRTSRGMKRKWSS
jgi:hypothetical protein